MSFGGPKSFIFALLDAFFRCTIDIKRSSSIFSKKMRPVQAGDLSPGGGGTTGIQAQKSTICVLLGLLGRFFALPERASKMTSKKHRKKTENRGFWSPKPLPQPFQNPLKIEVPKNRQFCFHFGSNFDACCKSQHQKNVRPRSVL